MTIALHTMVKNGVSKLPKLFESVKELVDRAIILDTGSTDGTVDWLHEQKILPCRVFRTTFKNFGETRTEGIKLAKGRADWLLLLDDDMRVRCDKPIDEIKKSIDPLAVGYMLRIDQPVTYWVTRFVTGNVEWKYKGVTHEYLERSIAMPKLEGLVVEHKFKHGKEKFDRDRRLLAADIARDPYDSRTIFYLAQTFRDQGEILPAIRYYQMRATMGGWPEEVYIAMFTAADLAKDPEAMKKAYHYRPSRAEAPFWLERFYKEKDPKQSEHYARIRAGIKSTSDILFVDQTAYA